MPLFGCKPTEFVPEPRGAFGVKGLAGVSRADNPLDQVNAGGTPGQPLRGWRIWRGLGFAVLGGLAPWLASCSVGVRTLNVSEPTLEVAPEAGTRELARGIVADPAPLSRLYVPLGQRMGICQIRSGGDWSALRRAVPHVGDEPDLSRGIAIAIISCAGQPLSGDWPISLDSVRVSQGGGYVCANFAGGTYLPDGMSYVDVAYVAGLTDVLMVDVNGVRFYP